MAVDTESHAKRTRTRSPSYPYLDLPTALEKAAVLWNVEGRHAVSVAVAMQHWGYKEESSTGYSCVAALKKFGLVDHDGMGETRQIRLSPLALAILLDRDPASADRRDAVRRAALNPRVHAELWERYGAELPSDQTLRRFLVVERNFNEASVDELLAEYKETVAFAGLLGRGGPTTAQTGVSAGVPPVTLAVPEAPRGLQKPQGRAGDARTTLWQDRPEAASFAVPAAPAGVPAPVPVATGRAVATNSRPPIPAGGPGSPARGRQEDLFGQPEDRFEGDVAEELLAPLPGPRAGIVPGIPAPTAAPDTAAPAGEAGARARRELPVPLDNGLVARVPYPMSEEDFSLLMDTLQLWKKRLVRS